MLYLARPLANRGVHLRITPRPSTLGESREILRLLSQFGEIDYFKSLKYDGKGLGMPNIGLVIFKDEEGAKACFRGSPVRFRMGKVKAGAKQQPSRQEEEEPACKEQSNSSRDTAPVRRGPMGAPFGLEPERKGPLSTPFGLEPDTSRQRRYLSTSTLPQPTPRPIRMPFEPPSPDDSATQQAEEEDRIYQIHTSAARRNFRDHINMGHYHGSFAIDSKMPGQGDLAKKVPTLGLSCVDWRAPERPWRFVKRDGEARKEGERERLGVVYERAVKEGPRKGEARKREARAGVDASGDVVGAKSARRLGRVDPTSMLRFIGVRTP